MKFISSSLTETKEFAVKIAKQITSPCLLLFYGDFGAGKTTMCRHIVQHFIPDANVSSPSFGIVNRYNIGIDTDNYGNEAYISHYDLYRIKSVSEIEEIGLMESINNDICLIEWPELVKFFLPSSNVIEFYLSINKDQTRTFKYERYT
jgi:tRNA threonylcarbamoyladenosine biosynthesis protein TsaE